MASGLELDIKLTGGKNLAKLSFGDKAYLKEALGIAARRIRRRGRQGRTGDGRRMPAYSEKYRRALERQGRSTTPDLEDSGQMWRSMRGKVNTKLQGSVAFSGGRRTAAGDRATIRQRKKNGEIRVRNLTNQMLASILAFRRTGKPMPPRPMNFVPDGRFMDLGRRACEHLVRLYDRYHTRHLAGLPPALI